MPIERKRKLLTKKTDGTKHENSYALAKILADFPAIFFFRFQNGTDNTEKELTGKTTKQKVKSRRRRKKMAL